MAKVSPMLSTVTKLVAAAKATEAFSTAVHFSMSIDNAPHERLVVESFPAPDRFCGEKRWITVSHYFDDGEKDCDLLMTETGLVLSYEYRGPFGQVYCRIYWRDETTSKQMVNLYQERDTAPCIRMWSTNIRRQGFITAAKKKENVTFNAA